MANEVISEVWRYKEYGLSPIPVRQGEKRPAISDWPKRYLSDREINKYFGNGKMNVGVVLGKMSGGLFDIDCDCAEARMAAAKLLPSTATFGRASNPKSHLLYFVPASPPDSYQFKDVDGSVIVEIRGDKCQTIFPPSIHPSGEQVYWYTDLDQIAQISSGQKLKEAGGLVATVSIVARHYMERGSRNELCLALAGVCLRHGIRADETEYLIKLIAKIAGDEEWRDRGNCVKNTLERLAKKETVYGIPKLKELLGQEVTARLCEWMGFDDDSSVQDNSAVSLYSDLTNAEYFIKEHGGDLHYNVDTKEWQNWDSNRWAYDHKGRTNRLVIKSVRSMYSLLEGVVGEKEQKELLKHIQNSESRSRLEAIKRLAESFEGIPVREHELNTNDMLFNVVNGTVNLETGKLQDHSKGDLITKLSPVLYDPSAKCPRWEKFLREVFQDNKELIAFMQWSCGIWLTGDVSEESMWVLLGKAQSGKSKFLSVVSYIMGDYAGTAAMSTFTEKHEMNTYDLATLSSMRFVTATEASDSDAFDERLLKKLAGRDMIKCRPIYGRPIEYLPKFKIAIATNEIPRMKSQGFDMQRRLKIVPFRQRFYERDEGKQPVKDPHILRKLLTEASGILNWMLEGCLEWQRHGGLVVPACVKAETGSVFEEQDTLAEFLDVCCVLDPNENTRVSELWRYYKRWIEWEGIDLHTAFKQPQGLTRNLTRRDGIERGKTPKGKRGLRGIGLKPGSLDEFDEF